MRFLQWSVWTALIGFVGSLVIADDKKIEVSDLPKVVVKAAKAAFPEAKIVGASKETDDDETTYEVMMTLKGQSIDLTIDDEGEIEEVEKEIEVEDLPRAVTKAVKKKFPQGKISKVEEVSDEDDMVVYELSIEIKDGKTIEVVLSPNGKILDDDDDDDDDDEEKKDEKDRGNKKKSKKD